MMPLHRVGFDYLAIKTDSGEFLACQGIGIYLLVCSFG